MRPGSPSTPRLLSSHPPCRGLASALPPREPPPPHSRAGDWPKAIQLVRAPPVGLKPRPVRPAIQAALRLPYSRGQGGRDLPSPEGGARPAGQAGSRAGQSHPPGGTPRPGGRWEWGDTLLSAPWGQPLPEIRGLPRLPRDLSGACSQDALQRGRPGQGGPAHRVRGPVPLPGAWSPNFLPPTRFCPWGSFIHSTRCHWAPAIAPHGPSAKRRLQLSPSEPEPTTHSRPGGRGRRVTRTGRPRARRAPSPRAATARARLGSRRSFKCRRGGGGARATGGQQWLLRAGSAPGAWARRAQTPALPRASQGFPAPPSASQPFTTLPSASQRLPGLPSPSQRFPALPSASQRSAPSRPAASRCARPQARPRGLPREVQRAWAGLGCAAQGPRAPSRRPRPWPCSRAARGPLHCCRCVQARRV